jgi:hypothetical protein
MKYKIKRMRTEIENSKKDDSHVLILKEREKKKEK